MSKQTEASVNGARIDHLGIAVESIAEAARILRGARPERDA